MFRPKPVDGDAVFGDGDYVNISWLAGFIYKKIKQ